MKAFTTEMGRDEISMALIDSPLEREIFFARTWCGNSSAAQSETFSGVLCLLVDSDQPILE